MSDFDFEFLERNRRGDFLDSEIHAKLAKCEDGPKVEGGAESRRSGRRTVSEAEHRDR